MPKKVVGRKKKSNRMTVSAYARKVGRHLGSVQKAVAAGFIVRGADGLIDEEQANRDWLARGDTRPKGVAGEESINLAQARVMHEQYRAQAAKLEFERKAQELVPLQEVNAWFASVIVRARDELLRIGPELQDQLAEERNPAAIGALINHRVRQALSVLKEYAEERAAAA